MGDDSAMVGRIVSHYRIEGHLGAGGMGTVYLAQDLSLQRKVALKFLDPGTRTPDASERLLREARAASALDHPHIGTVYEIGDADGQPFIAMAYYEGQTLASRLRAGPLSNGEAARLIAEVADALAAAHAAGVVHRDLKPSNLMLTSAGHIKVLDFGIAMFASTESETIARLTGAGSAIGTAAYMSPEQAAGEAVDARSDLWSLGAVLHEMLTGRPAFEGSNTLALINAVRTAPIPAVQSHRPDLAPELEAILTRTLVRDRRQRAMTAAEVRDLAASCAARVATGVTAVVPLRRGGRRVLFALGAAVLAGIAVTAVWWSQRNARVRWAREQALPEIIRLAGVDQFDPAFRLAVEAEPYLETEPVFQEQMRAITRAAAVESEPPGATISYRPYGHPDEAWRPLGRAPLKDLPIPRGLHQWKAELAGFETAEDVGPAPFWPPRFLFRLVPAGKAPADMVRVSSDQPFQLYIPGLDHLPAVALADYWIDRHEVTNREFKRFVDDGGYRKAELWREPFVRDGKPISAAEAMVGFVDTTGRPGPALWEQGSYPAGLADHPVSGVSWYEAAAFARWAGKSLPTIYHWSRAADQRLSGNVVPASNFGGKEVLPVDRAGGPTRAGTSGMAGNVKEWVWNAAGARRYILGGAWNEPVYMFNDVDAQPPLSRLPAYGFRCVKLDRPEDLAPNLVAEVTLPSRDLQHIVPPSDAVFQAWKSIYSFDHGHLAAKVESVDDSSPEWRMEKVSYAAAYGDERITAYLFLPKNAAPPYQAIVYFPGSGVINRRTAPMVNDFERMNYIMRSGRALIYPIYKSTHERGDMINSDYPSMSAVWRDHMVMWSKDVGRSIDYLESRPDIDRQKIGYHGISWGAGMAPLFLAVEPRLKLGLLLVGGFYLQPAMPEADPVNFVARVKVPVVMLNGRFDFFFPTEASQKPMFDNLGTRPEDKRRVEYDASHSLPRNEVIKEFVGWMDKYWGPVRPPR